MFKQIRSLTGVTALVATLSLSATLAVSLALLPRAAAQMSEQEPSQASGPSTLRLAQRNTAQSSFQGRGVAQGSAFTRGRNATVSLTIDGSNFGIELAEPPGTRARVQYRGSIIRQNNGPANSNSFTLDGRVRSFNSSANLRVLNNTTGTCRVEVFDARVISSTCNAVADDSSTRFLGLEQF